MKHEVTTYNTKKALAASLKKAMKKKPFSKITVSEIVSDCGVNRKTFYYHFEDIYALLKWMFEEEAIEVVKQFDFLVDYDEAITFIMDYIENNEHIISCAYDSIGREELKRFLGADFIGIVRSMIESVEEQTKITLEAEYKDFLTAFYTEAFTGMLIDWLKNKKSRNRRLIYEYLTKTVQSSLLGIFERYKSDEEKDTEQL